MQGKHLYEYAVIRVLPVVEREEFVNVGIVMFCKQQDYIRVLHKVDERKLRPFSSELDITMIHANIQAFEQIAQGKAKDSPIAGMDLPSRFRWLTAVRSSAIQTSRPHPGICNDLEETAERLFKELVL
jgi:hypothetical protein